jgi:hypothetical protein
MAYCQRPVLDLSRCPADGVWQEATTTDRDCRRGVVSYGIAVRGGFEGRIMEKDLCVRRISRTFALAAFVLLGLVSPWAHPHVHAQGQETVERTDALRPEGSSPFEIHWQFDTGG